MFELNYSAQHQLSVSCELPTESRQGTNSQLVVLSSLPELLFYCSQHARSLEAECDVLQGLFQRIGEFHNHRHFFTSYQFTFGLQDKERTMNQKLLITDTQYWQGRRMERTEKQHKAKEA